LTFMRICLARSTARFVEKKVPQDGQTAASVQMPFSTASWCMRVANSFNLTPAGHRFAHSSQVRQYQKRASVRSARASSSDRHAGAKRRTTARGSAKYGMSPKTSGSGHTAEHAPHCSQNRSPYSRIALRNALKRGLLFIRFSDGGGKGGFSNPSPALLIEYLPNPALSRVH
jgi:hypothetical protein